MNRTIRGVVHAGSRINQVNLSERDCRGISRNDSDVRRMSYYGKTLVVLCCIFAMLLTGCAKKVAISDTEYVPADGSISVASLTSGIAEKEANRVAEFRKKEKTKYDRHYGNGLYLKDYKTVKERLNGELERWLEQRLYQEIAAYKKEQKITDSDGTQLIVQAQVECYNDVLEDVQKRGTTIEAILKNPAWYVRSINVDVCSLENTRKSDRESSFYAFTNSVFREVRNPIVNSGVPFNAAVFLYRKEDMKSLTLEDLKKADDLRAVLVGNGGCYGVRSYEGITKDDEMRNNCDFQKESEVLKRLYGEDFVLLYGTGNGKNVISPKRDLSIKFEADLNSSRYLSVIAQKQVTGLLNQMLDAQGVSDHVFSFVAPEETTTHEELRMAYDVKGIPSPQDFIANYPVEYDANLYYLHRKGEPIDVEKVRAVAVEADALLPKGSSLAIQFYTVEDYYRNILTGLFKGQTMTEYRYRPELRGLDMSDMYITRTDTEGFRLLDLYAEKDSVAIVIGDPPIDTTVSAAEWFETTKKKNLWEDE